MSQNKTRLTRQERALANELAYLVAVMMWSDLGDDSAPDDIYNIGQSNYEAGCYALNLVGVYEQKDHYTSHRVVVPLDDVRQHMARLQDVSREALDELLLAFIENSISYYGGMSGGRRSFTPYRGMAKAAELLAATGYAELQGEAFKWTEKIGPVMKQLYIWDENGDCPEERKQDLREKTATKMAETLPLFLRRKVSRALKNREYGTTIKVLSSHWDGEQWVDFPLAGEKPKSGGKPDLRTWMTLFQMLV